MQYLDLIKHKTFGKWENIVLNLLIHVHVLCSHMSTWLWLVSIEMSIKIENIQMRSSVMAVMEHKQKDLYYVLINYITENTVRSDRSIASQFAGIGIFWIYRTSITICLLTMGHCYAVWYMYCQFCSLSFDFVCERARFILTHCDDKLGLREFDELTYSQYCFLNWKI